MVFLPKEKLTRPPSLSDKIAKRLAAEIRKGNLAPGDSLPTEREIGEAYGVSRSVVREAVSRLKQEGLVESHQGRPARIVDLGGEAHGSGKLKFKVEGLRDPVNLAYIVELIMPIESEAAALAAERRTSEDLARIRQHLDGIKADIKLGKIGTDHDMLFHRAIVQATGNPYLIELMDHLERPERELIRTARLSSKNLKVTVEQGEREHQAIFDAIAASQPREAYQAAVMHLRNAAIRLSVPLKGKYYAE